MLYLFIFFLCAPPLVARAADAAPVAFYYFNPDSFQSNLNLLKREMDQFVSRSNYPITFQAFANYPDFDETLKRVRPAFMLLPRWYMNKYQTTFKLKPILMPTRSGKNSYRKVLLKTVNRDIDLHNLASYSLAMTSMGPDSEQILDTILFKTLGQKSENMHVVQVPRDSDALFALILGQVDLALVTEGNLDKLVAINPHLKDNIRPIRETAPIPLPVLCYLADSVSEVAVRQFTLLFLNATGGADRNAIMEMLQIDGWEAFTH